MEDNQEQDQLKLDVTDLPTLDALEKRYLKLVMTKAGGNKAKAAEILGVSVKTIYNKLDTHLSSVTTQA